ncbi:MAG: threonine/serine exporter family protein [Lachnospirales bacterium]
MILELFLVTLSVVGFGFVFEVPTKEIKFGAFVGLVTWLVYLLFVENLKAESATLMGAMVGTYLARELTYCRKMPLTVFVLPGMLPLAPGYVLYKAMESTFLGSGEVGLYAMKAIKYAGAIGIGMGIALSLPSFIRYRMNKANASNININIKKRRY